MLEVGARVWIPCDVKPGPFSNERLVRIQENGSAWLGFVPVDRLKEPILEGQTLLLALVTAVMGEKFFARVPGETLTSSHFEGLVSRVRPLGPLEA